MYGSDEVNDFKPMLKPYSSEFYLKLSQVF
nr:MAG TPA: hypothetical protein [Bacteriophage sp.]